MPDPHPQWTDDDLVLGLREIDESEEIECSDWECDFLDSIKKMPKPRRLSQKQRDVAGRMIRQYLGEDWRP
jgi:hypothetical protein